jgi:hypothetical protein
MITRQREWARRRRAEALVTMAIIIGRYKGWEVVNFESDSQFWG